MPLGQRRGKPRKDRHLGRWADQSGFLTYPQAAVGQTFIAIYGIKIWRALRITTMALEEASRKIKTSLFVSGASCQKTFFAIGLRSEKVLSAIWKTKKERVHESAERDILNRNHLWARKERRVVPFFYDQQKL